MKEQLQKVKSIIVDGNKNVTGLNNVSITNLSTDEITLNGTTLTSTAAELNRLNNVSAGSVKLNAAVVVDDNKDISGFRDVSVNRDVHVGGKINTNEVTSGNIIVKNNNIGVSDNEDVITVSSSQVTVEGALDASSIKINGNAVTASASDLNILTGTTLTSAELDSLSGSKKGETVANKVAVYDANGKLTSTTLETTNLTSSTSNMGNLSISGSSITSSDPTGIDFADTILRTTGTINSGELNASDITASGNITINGNLNVKGTTTTINTTNVEVSDPLMILSSGTEGVPSVDSGFIIERGTSQNVGLIWDESLDVFSFVNTDNTGDTTTNVTIDSYADVRVKNLILDNGTVSTTINADDLSKLNGVTDGTLAANKAIITDNNQHVDKLKTTSLYLGESGTATKVNSSADEINLLNTASAGTVVDGKAVVYSASGQVIATTLKSTGIAEVASGSKIGTRDHNR